MTRILLIILFIIAFPTNFIYASEKNISEKITPVKYQSMLGSGLDVDWSKTTRGAGSYSKQAVKNFAGKGFSHVRIRVKDDISDRLLRQLSTQVNDCLENGIIPIIAYQAKNFKENPTEDNLYKTVKWWDDIAEHFKNYSDSLSFDILIECTDKLNKNQKMLNRLFEYSVSTIRKSNPERIVFISPIVRSSPENLKYLDIPTKANGYLMAEWHFYASGPSKSNKNKLWTTGTDSEKKIILNKIECATQWSEKTGIPTWVGAWMPGNYNDGNDYSVSEQMEFAAFVVSALNSKKIPFAVNEGSKYYEYSDNKWIKEILPLINILTGAIK